MTHSTQRRLLLLPALLGGTLCVAALTPGRLLGDGPVTVTAAAAASQPAATQAAINATPEAVFKRFQETAQAKDFGGMFDCFTNEGQNDLVGKLALFVNDALSSRDAGTHPTTQPDTQPSEARRFYDKYKLGEVLKNVPGRPKDPRRVTFVVDWRPLGTAEIQNKRAFAVEALPWQIKAAESEGESPLAELAKATLTEVKIEGDRATAVFNIGEGHQPMQFKKVNGSWLIEPLN